MSEEHQATRVPQGRRLDLRADCTRCFGLCCVAPGFAASTDFAINKPPGHACPNLSTEFRCSIHQRLRDRGFGGCAVYDCFGAGQHVSQVTFGGQDWRGSPEIAQRMFRVYATMRDLHELLWYLTEALSLHKAGPLHGELRHAYDETLRLTRDNPETLAALDLGAHRQSVNSLLLRTSELVRATVARPETEYRGADLIGRNMRGTDLTGANLRGAYLIGADLSGAKLALADFIGADLRGANVARADLSTGIFLTQFQINAAMGDSTTALPATLVRPAHWRSRASTSSSRRRPSRTGSP